MSLLAKASSILFLMNFFFDFLTTLRYSFLACLKSYLFGAALTIDLNFYRALLHAVSHHVISLPRPKELCAAPEFTLRIADLMYAARYSKALGEDEEKIRGLQLIEIQSDRRK